MLFLSWAEYIQSNGVTYGGLQREYLTPPLPSLEMHKHWVNGENIRPPVPMLCGKALRCSYDSTARAVGKLCMTR